MDRERARGRGDLLLSLPLMVAAIPLFAVLAAVVKLDSRGIDLFYARRRSVLMDITILGWTAVPALLRRDVAVHRDSGRLSVRRRPRAVALAALETGDA